MGSHRKMGSGGKPVKPHKSGNGKGLTKPPYGKK